MPDEKTVLVVFDMESDDAPMPLGKYLYSVEDVVFYTSHRAEIQQAPADCVAVVSVTVAR